MVDQKHRRSLTVQALPRENDASRRGNAVLNTPLFNLIWPQRRVWCCCLAGPYHDDLQRSADSDLCAWSNSILLNVLFSA